MYNSGIEQQTYGGQNVCQQQSHLFYIFTNAILISKLMCIIFSTFVIADSHATNKQITARLLILYKAKHPVIRQSFYAIVQHESTKIH